MPEFNEWFPTSLYGDNALNVMSFGAHGDGIVHSMSDLGYANLAAAQVDYPSAVSADLSDTSDWCAITECLKHAYKHETSPGVWVSNRADGRPDKPVCFPTGRYITRKPVIFRDLTQATIYGVGYVQIFNESSTPPDNVGVIFDCFQSCRVDNIDMQSIGGVGLGAQGCRIDAFGGAYVNTTGNIFYNCNFAAPGGVGCHIGQTQMSSEMTFIKCNASTCEYGFVIDNWNALNYQFLACGGIDNTYQWLRVNTGGMCVVTNASLAGNGTNDPYEGFDIANGAGSIVIIGSRSESRRFVNGMNVTMIGCLHATAGAQSVFANASPLNMINCQSTMSRVCGSGPIKIDEDSIFCFSRFWVTNIAAGTGGRVKITHTRIEGDYDLTIPVFYDGDEVKVQDVVSANMTSSGGAAHTNGVWIIAKLDETHFELIDSTFVADTYDYTNAMCGGGPRWHLREVIYPPIPGAGTTSVAGALPTSSRFIHASKTRDFTLLPGDSGTTLDNYRATGPVTFTLPFSQKPDWVSPIGTRFYFTVLEPQMITIKVNDTTITSPSTRIFRAGGFATAGLTVSSNVVGNTIEIVLADGATSNPTSDVGLAAYRWLIRSETGTWTIAGTPS